MRLSLALLGIVAGCGYSPARSPVSLRAESYAGQAILTVMPARDLRINARVPPGLELAAGGIIRLARGRISEDSTYFLEPPWQVRPAGVAIRGTLHVSYCRLDEAVCRSAKPPVDLPE